MVALGAMKQSLPNSGRFPSTGKINAIDTLCSAVKFLNLLQKNPNDPCNFIIHSHESKKYIFTACFIVIKSVNTKKVSGNTTYLQNKKPEFVFYILHL